MCVTARPGVRLCVLSALKDCEGLKNNNIQIDGAPEKQK